MRARVPQGQNILALRPESAGYITVVSWPKHGFPR
jgi:hypothetical protein